MSYPARSAGDTPSVGGSTETLPPTPQAAVRIGGKGWIEIKKFGKNKQRRYAYFRWREGRVKKSKYIGVSTP
jgi:hypothetical protein